MKLIIDRDKAPDEGVAFRVIARNESAPYEQFKIDVWSKKDTGMYLMRLDGFQFLRLWKDNTLAPLMVALFQVNPQDIVKEYKIIEEGFQKLIPGRPIIDGKTIVEYFEAARSRVLKEYEPLVMNSES